MLNLTGRYYQTIPMHRAGYVTEALQLDPARTALVGMHCWNIGCDDGPNLDDNYWVGLGFPATTREAGRIMRECIRPAMDAARRAGVTVCHVETSSIARLHPQAHDEEDPPQPVSTAPPLAPVVPGWTAKMAERFHGRNFEKQPPYATMDRAAVVAAQAGEPFAYQTGQFDRILRRRGIENLIYSGFAADMFILRAAGGIEPMWRSGYRMFLMRDATLGVECPDTWNERIATRWATRYFETHYGDTIESADFMAACAT